MNKIKGEKMGMEMEFDPKKPRMPELRLALTDIPEAKDWEVGQVYNVEFELKMTGLHQDADGKGYATFEPQELEVESEEDEAAEGESENEEDNQDDGEDGKSSYVRK